MTFIRSFNARIHYYMQPLHKHQVRESVTLSRTWAYTAKLRYISAKTPSLVDNA